MIRLPGLIAVTGGMGSGKSVVCGILSAMGYKVYDCDSRAKTLIDNDPAIISKIESKVGLCTLPNGALDRPRLASIVFHDNQKLEILNRLVHAEVRKDLTKWYESEIDTCDTPLFVETAILYQSRLDLLVSQVWEVKAPELTRIKRTMARDQSSRDKILARIQAQDSYTPSRHHPVTYLIINDGCHALLPQVEGYLATV